MARKIVEWEAIDPLWRAGIMPKKQLAASFGISRIALDKHFNKRGITRDLKDAIKAKTEDMVARAEVTQPEVITKEVTFVDNKLLAPRLSDEEVINAAAATQTAIILKHRKNLGRLQHVVDGMIAEITAQSITSEELAHVAELVALAQGQGDEHAVSPAKVQQRIDAFTKLLGLSGRVDTLAKLTTSLKTLVGMERQAFGLADNSNGDADTPETTKPSENETARRVAFVMMQAIQIKNDSK